MVNVSIELIELLLYFAIDMNNNDKTGKRMTSEDFRGYLNDIFSHKIEISTIETIIENHYSQQQRAEKIKEQLLSNAEYIHNSAMRMKAKAPETEWTYSPELDCVINKATGEPMRNPNRNMFKVNLNNQVA